MTQCVPGRRLAFEASLLTSTTTLRQAMKDPGAGVAHPLSGLRAGGVLTRQMTVENALGAVAVWMLANYRNEAVYKNAIANKVLVERHGWDRATLLSEFKVGTSVADCVVVNGHASVYEIKTELDNPAKLARQLADYRRVFRSVTVVTYRSLATLYKGLLADQPVGLVVLSDDGTLRTRRKAPAYDHDLSVGSMMKSLRKSEYTRIAELILGEHVDEPATRHFSRCMEIARSIPPLDYCRLLEDELRNRKPREQEAISSEAFRHVRHQLIKIDPNRKQMANASEWVTRRI